VHTIELGRIIWADLPSSDGTQKKRRPAVIVTPTKDIVAGKNGKEFVVVALTTKIPDQLPADHVKIPWKRDGRTGTGLKVPTVAVCTWLLPINEFDIHEFAGIVPTKVMIEIAKILHQKENPSEPKSPH
jgi:mRNA-degrading endonuclease toxin of MazEF toxin-antitoxin module